MVFSQFFETTQTAVYRYIYGLTGGPAEEVGDLTADTYAKAWSARFNFRGDKMAALCWVFTIAKHQVIDQFRRNKAKRSTQSLETCEPHAPESCPEHQFIRSEEREQLWRLLQQLPENAREPLILRYMLDWSVKDIAVYLHKNETAVSMQIHRTLKQIQQGWPESFVPSPDRSEENVRI
jgi:RNA polymerase sigma-70 factor (ECF subfamily)